MKMKKMSESKFKRMTKLVEAKGLFTYEVTFNGETVGTIERNYHGWRALGVNGEFIGLGSTKAEAKYFVAEEHVGMENVDWK
jgi:hypothetical protein